MAEHPPRPVEIGFSIPGRIDIQMPVFMAPHYDIRELGVSERHCRWLASEGLAHARDLQHMLACTALALRDAELPISSTEAHTHIALVVADEHPGFEALSSRLLALKPEQSGWQPGSSFMETISRDFFRLNTFLYPHFVARVFGFTGMSLFVNSACSSGLNAIDVAASEIRNGRSTVAVAVATDDPLNPTKLLWFKNAGLYAVNGRLEPFGREQTGTLPGDGGAALILEDRQSALQRGARIYAEIAGAAFAQDGWKVMHANPVSKRAVAVFAQTCREAGVPLTNVDVVVPHGCGIASTDMYEARCLHASFGSQAAWPHITALKPYVGHCLGASSLVESALLLGCMARDMIPPTTGSNTPYTRWPIELVRTWRFQPVNVAIKSTCAMAGYIGAIAFSRHAHHECRE
ncbi:MAG: hypothetical protein JST22_05390 [Bacteroidetes bacterium]|nr:hypothetical protein [Bacteroidota bacterium]